MKRLFVPCLILFFALGWGLRETGAQETGSEIQPPHWVEDVLKTRSGPIPTQARIFLMAGSSLTANFAQEIVDQKKIWLAKGIPPEEIVCYYVVPTQEEFEEEPEQFEALAVDLKECYPANAKQLREDLLRAAKQNPPYLYLYMTSHGRQPISEKLKVLKQHNPSYHQYRYLGRFAVLDQYGLDIEGLPDGSAGPYELIGAYRGGMDPEEIFLTPRYLTGFLKREFPHTPKYIMLQGCFTGGFLVDPRKEYWDGLLTTLDRVTVLTAAQYNRESFGCDPGAKTTYYGGAFNGVLQKMGQAPNTTDWKALHQVLRENIRQIETKMGVQKPSNPRYFSNQTGVPEFD